MGSGRGRSIHTLHTISATVVGSLSVSVCTSHHNLLSALKILSLSQKCIVTLKFRLTSQRRQRVSPPKETLRSIFGKQVLLRFDTVGTALQSNTGVHVIKGNSPKNADTGAFLAKALPLCFSWHPVYTKQNLCLEIKEVQAEDKERRKKEVCCQLASSYLCLGSRSPVVETSNPILLECLAGPESGTRDR
jgi:hypothetical protein